jgi:cobalt-zinc-cadmium efflux system outer membrane protein
LIVKLACFIALVLVVSRGLLVTAQDATQTHGGPTTLSDAVAEAENNNTQIAAADHAWQASAHVAQLVTALADSQSASTQSFNAAGSKPIAGLNSSSLDDQAVDGSQKPRYTGELRPWSEVARREADTQQAQIDIYRSNIADQVKTTYLRLAYLVQMHDLDVRGAADFAALIDNELSKYGLGMGSQAEVLQAQLERTKVLRETTLHNEEVDGLQATVKALLHRPPDSPDIITEPISATPLKQPASELLLKAASQSPTLNADSKMIAAQEAQLDAVKSNTNPDFSFGYPFPQAGENYHDGYVMSFSLRLPRDKSVDALIAAASDRLESARSQASEDGLRQLAEVQKQYVTVTRSDELMKECKEGLIPQSKAVYQARLAGYQSDRENFSSVIEAFLDEITFEGDYLQALLDHETALAHLETLTGEKLR